MLVEPMNFEWDENKREANLAKHGIDFDDAITMWRRPVIERLALRWVNGEARYTALGLAGPDDFIITVVYTMRPDAFRIISARRARRNERKSYQDRFGRGR